MKAAVPSLLSRGIDWLKNLARARNGSRAHLVLVGFGVVVLLVVIIAVAPKEIAHHKAAAVMTGATAPADVQPVQQTQRVAPTPARKVQPTSIAGSTPANLVAVPSAAPTHVQVAVAPAAALAPPAGLVAGQAIETIADVDQFGQYSTVSTRAVSSIRTSWQSYVGSPYAPAWRETITGWFQLSAPATVALLRRGGGAAAARVSAEIDGASLGPALRGPASEVAALPLEAGWHSFSVVAENQSLSYLATATPIELAIGNGTDTPMPVAPYAPAQTAAKTTPASTSSAPTVPAKASAATTSKEH